MKSRRTGGGRYIHRFVSRAEFALWKNGRLFATEDDADEFKVLKCFRVVSTLAS